MELSNKFKLILAVVAVAIIATGFWKWIKYIDLQPSQTLYQVVLLRNDQVFYGKLHKINFAYPYLTDVYYLNPQQPQLDRQGRQIGGTKFTVVKRGIDEIHQPTDKLYIPRENIIYWENVGPNSKVEQGIKADRELRARSK